jgi:hypothetical protein
VLDAGRLGFHDVLEVCQVVVAPRKFDPEELPRRLDERPDLAVLIRLRVGEPLAVRPGRLELPAPLVGFRDLVYLCDQLGQHHNVQQIHEPLRGEHLALVCSVAGMGRVQIGEDVAVHRSSNHRRGLQVAEQVRVAMITPPHHQGLMRASASIDLCPRSEAEPGPHALETVVLAALEKNAQPVGVARRDRFDQELVDALPSLLGLDAQVSQPDAVRRQPVQRVAAQLPLLDGCQQASLLAQPGGRRSGAGTPVCW